VSRIADDAPNEARGTGLPLALQRFLQTEVAGGVVLLAAALVALVWANSPWRAGYESLWATRVQLSLGNVQFDEDLRHVVNDALMAVFFFVVGLEIKRELVVGELRNWRTAALPAIAALGGMVVPALLYTAFNAGGPGARGWGVPMATDIAFAIGVLALLGDRVPAALKLFLLTLAIVDDLGAIAVIALFYAGDVDLTMLGLAAAGLAGVVALRAAGVRWSPLFFVAGVAVWFFTFESGVHATIAGAALGLLVPARPVAAAAVAREWAVDLSDEPTPADLRTMTRLANRSMSPAERLQHDLHPVTSFFIVPLFALANAGVTFRSGAFDAPGAGAVAAGIAIGLVVGKTVGVSGAAWLAMRLGVGVLPGEIGLRQVVGAAAVAGIGFTVSLFITDLAFPAELRDIAKVSVLAASAVAAVIGALILRLSAVDRPPPRRPTPRASWGRG
jgi:NhaA family Na+:H+ antiporter